MTCGNLFQKDSGPAKLNPGARLEAFLKTISIVKS